jgi:hypothetical protein
MSVEMVRTMTGVTLGVLGFITLYYSVWTHHFGYWLFVVGVGMLMWANNLTHKH